MRASRARAAAVLASTLALAAAAAGTEPGRGQALYELRCQGCHSESVHARTHRTARTLVEVRAWVARWNSTLSLRWTAEEIDDVTKYLNDRYYRYPCPPTVCKVVSLAVPRAPRGALPTR